MSKLYVKSASRFRNNLKASTFELPFPTHPDLRFATLSDRVPQFGRLQPFNPESVIHLQGFCPNIIAGTSAELHKLAGELGLGMIDLSCLDHAIVVLTPCRQPPLADVDRVVFWQAFGVPVFEVFISFDDTVLAYECELHEGWHLAPQVKLTHFDGELVLDAPGVLGLQTALTGTVTGDPCPCGRPGLRLLHMERVQKAPALPPWAATA